MLPLLLAALPLLQAPAPAPKAESKAEASSLSFASIRQPYLWDKLMQVDLAVDGLKVNSIFFNLRESKVKLFQGPTFGTRAQVEVTNTSKATKIPGFAVAVLDAEGHLLGAATGGSKLTGIKAGETETFDLNFGDQVKARIPKGATYLLTVELR
ncbi:MAG TPA: hypothetical protein VJ570_02435 [Holophagaceae bacterium]|nr:hypothetical protein [Holophagaceae bacterium]